MDCTRAENHKADLTLADDWEQKWEKNPTTGVSLIKINTKKGKSIFSTIRDEMIICPVELRERSSMVQAHHYSEERRKKTFNKYLKSQKVETLQGVYKQIKFRNETKKWLIYVLSKFYRTIIPRRKDYDNK